MTIELKGTTIKMTCETAEEAHRLYANLGHDYTFIINGVEIESWGKYINNSYFGGYTSGWFRQFEK